MLLQIIIVDEINIHVLNVFHEIWLWLLISSVNIVISLNENGPTYSNVNLFPLFFCLMFYLIFSLLKCTFAMLYILFNGPILLLVIILISILRIFTHSSYVVHKCMRSFVISIILIIFIRLVLFKAEPFNFLKAISHKLTQKGRSFRFCNERVKQQFLCCWPKFMIEC